MIFLIILYLSFFSGHWKTLALPTDFRPPEILPKNHLQSIFTREGDRFDTRSIYNILWSCLSIIFACSWITVHPNIPAPRDSKWAVIGRRVAIMGYFLLSPEFVIMWAARQHFGARSLTRKYSKEHPGWTQAHSFFLIMGGFMLHERGKAVRVLEAEQLENLSKEGKVQWPTITEEEIADRSKGDYLSKAIVLCQTTWFIVQCIARGAYGLTVTELEVVTIAFASLTGVTYYLWWDKPVDVRCSIPVHLVDGQLGEIEGNIKKEESTSPIPPPENSSDQEVSEGDEHPRLLLTTSIQADTSIPDDLSHNIFPPEVSDPGIPQADEKVIHPDPLPSTRAQGDTSTLDPGVTGMQRFRNFRRNACEEHGTFFGIAYVFIGFPLVQFFGAFMDMVGCETLEGKTLRVPTFYAPPEETDVDGTEAIIAVCVSIVFGAIHCIAWSFHFATLKEQWLWRISAILVSASPISIAVVSVVFTMFDYREENESTWMELYNALMLLTFFITSCLYITARIILLILPFWALRALPPGAYVELNWISFIPHI